MRDDRKGLCLKTRTYLFLFLCNAEYCKQSLYLHLTAALIKRYHFNLPQWDILTFTIYRVLIGWDVEGHEVKRYLVIDLST